MTSAFGQPWWLDAVAPGQWGEATVERNGKTAARLPWARERLNIRGLRLTRVGSPPLTPFLTPELDLGAGKLVTRLANEHKLLNALLADLPPADYTSFTFGPSFTNWLPFHWNGFAGSLRATYVLDGIQDLDAVWRGMSDDTRNVVRKAEKVLTVREDDDGSELAAAVASTFERQGRQTPLPEALLGRLVGAVRKRGLGTVLTAVDPDGVAHGSLLVVRDGDRAYYLTGGTHAALRRSGAQSLLVWDAIRRSAEYVSVFDFEGSMIEGVANFFRGFGSTPVPYVQVTKTSRRLGVAIAARDMARALTSRR